MTYASEKLNDEVIRNMRKDFVKCLKPIDMLLYLPCLTQSDRQEIEAKQRNDGDMRANYLLLDYMVRRDKWPEQFISALINCEHRTLADEVQEKYDQIRGIKKQKPGDVAALPSVPAGVSVVPTTSHSHSFAVPTAVAAVTSSNVIVASETASPESSSCSAVADAAASEEQYPVQETNPPQPRPKNMQNKSNRNQIVEAPNTAVSAACQTEATFSTVSHVSPSAESNDAHTGHFHQELYYSKPGVLREEEPLSITSDDLAISRVSTESEVHLALSAESNSQRLEESSSRLNSGRSSSEQGSVSANRAHENAAVRTTPESSNQVQGSKKLSEQMQMTHAADTKVKLIRLDITEEADRPLLTASNQPTNQSQDEKTAAQSQTQCTRDLLSHKFSDHTISKSIKSSESESEEKISRLKSSSPYIAAAAAALAVIMVWRLKL